MPENWSRVTRFGAPSVSPRDGELLAASLPTESSKIDLHRDSTVSESLRAAPNDRSRLVGLAVITAAFITSRLFALNAGIFMHVHPDFVQLLDFPLLSSHLTQSIFYLHAQPPLLNLTLGLALKLFPNSYPIFFAVIFWLLGLLLALTLYNLMTGLGVPWWISLTLTVLFEISPATLLFENLYYDTYPVAFLLCYAAYSLNRFLRTGSRFHGKAFVVVLGLPMFLNPSFQIVWFLGVGGILLFLGYERIKPLVPTGLVILVLILSIYIKNLIVFGTFSTSSSLGMGITEMTTRQLPNAELNDLVKRHILSPFALLPPFPVVEAIAPHTGVPVLDETVDSGFGMRKPNTNCSEYIEVARSDLHDALWVIIHRPGAFAQGEWRGIKNYFDPASINLLYLQRNRILPWCKLYEGFLYPPGLPTFAVDPLMDTLIRAEPATGPPSTVLMIVFPGLALFAILKVVSSWRIQRLRDADGFTMLYIVLAILYLTPLGSLVTLGESNRYRYLLDPLYVALLGVLLGQVWNTLAAKMTEFSTSS